MEVNDEMHNALPAPIMKDRSRSRELLFAMLVLASATALALSPDAYLPMLARAFMLQWAVVFTVVAFFAVLRKHWWLVLSGLFAAVIVLLQVRLPVVSPGAVGSGPALRIAQMNVLQPNLRHEEVIRCALSSGAELISFQEVSPEWAEALINGLDEAYPYRHVEARTDCYGIALFSRRPFVAVRTLVVKGSPFVDALIRSDGRTVRVLAVHATSPTSYAEFGRRNAQFDALAVHIASADLPTIVIGDLNTVPWDRAYGRFCRLAGMRALDIPDLRTWPAIGPIALIPLDHALASRDLASSAVNTFPIPGSDHRGLLTDLHLTSHAR